MEFPFWEASNTELDAALSSPFWLPLVEQGVGQGGLWSTLLSSSVL